MRVLNEGRGACPDRGNRWKVRGRGGGVKLRKGLSDTALIKWVRRGVKWKKRNIWREFERVDVTD